MTFDTTCLQNGKYSFNHVSMIMILINSMLWIEPFQVFMTTYVSKVYAKWDVLFVFSFFLFCHSDTERNHFENPQCIKLTILELSHK